MASVIKNRGGQATKLNRGSAVNLGSIATAGDVVAFTISEMTQFHNGTLMIQIGPGVTLGAGTVALEVSIDGAVSWVVVPIVTTLAITGQPGSDTAAVFAATYNVSGMGGGAQFRFGFVASPTSGTSPVFAIAS